MTDPLKPKQDLDVVAVPAPQTVEDGISKTIADIRASLTSEQRIDVQGSVPIVEDQLRPMRDALYQRQEFRELTLSSNALMEEGNSDASGELSPMQLAHIKRTEEVSMIFLREVEAECAVPDIDLPKTRMLMHVAYSIAKSLSAGKYKNFSALNALKAWQATLAAQNPAAVALLVETYTQTIIAEMSKEKPDQIWLIQWIDLCTGFAPELAEKLATLFQLAIQKRCEYFLTVVEAELAQERPDIGKIHMNITVPPKYFNQLPPGSTIPDRVKALEQRIDALKEK